MAKITDTDIMNALLGMQKKMLDVASKLDDERKIQEVMELRSILQDSEEQIEAIASKYGDKKIINDLRREFNATKRKTETLLQQNISYIDFCTRQCAVNVSGFLSDKDFLRNHVLILLRYTKEEITFNKLSTLLPTVDIKVLESLLKYDPKTFFCDRFGVWKLHDSLFKSVGDSIKERYKKIYPLIVNYKANEFFGVDFLDEIIQFRKTDFECYSTRVKLLCESKSFRKYTKDELHRMVFYSSDYQFSSFVVQKHYAPERTIPEFRFGDTLYIYKGNILCLRNRHNIVQATAIMHNQTDNEIKLNVEYCTMCKKFFLENTLFEAYKERFGVLIGNLRLIKNGDFSGEYELAQESPLHIMGYNVGMKDNFNEAERQYVLARVIHGKIMSKGEVIKYLSFFIKRNGAKAGNELALTKWKSDLSFVQNYNMSIQPSTIIDKIKPY